VTVVDTSVVVALLDADHPHHASAASRVATGPITATWGTLLETSMVIRRLAKDAGLDGNKAARKALRAIISLDGFREAGGADLRGVLALYDRSHALSFADAWTLSVAIETGEPLLTFDDTLRSAYERRRGKLS
jgi:predicted nucleic acid-binding protein